MNSKAIGEVSEAKIIARLLEKGYSVALPFGDNQRYDILLVEGNKAVRIQCKTGSYYRGGISFNTCSHNPFTSLKKYYYEDIDLFMVYHPETGKVYKVPIEGCPKGVMRLRTDAVKNGQHKKIRFACDYEF